MPPSPIHGKQVSRANPGTMSLNATFSRPVARRKTRNSSGRYRKNLSALLPARACPPDLAAWFANPKSYRVRSFSSELEEHSARANKKCHPRACPEDPFIGLHKRVSSSHCRPASDRRDFSSPASQFSVLAINPLRQALRSSGCVSN